MGNSKARQQKDVPRSRSRTAGASRNSGAGKGAVVVVVLALEAGASLLLLVLLLPVVVVCSVVILAWGCEEARRAGRETGVVCLRALSVGVR